MNSMLNVHNPRQCYMTKNWSRDLSLYQLGFGGRGIGFRDSSQDVMGVMSAMPGEARELIEKLLSVQKLDGSAMHQFYASTMVANEGDSREIGRPPRILRRRSPVDRARVCCLPERDGRSRLPRQGASLLRQGQGWQRPIEAGTVFDHLKRALAFTKKNVGSPRPAAARICRLERHRQPADGRRVALRRQPIRQGLARAASSLRGSAATRGWPSVPEGLRAHARRGERVRMGWRVVRALLRLRRARPLAATKTSQGKIWTQRAELAGHLRLRSRRARKAGARIGEPATQHQERHQAERAGYDGYDPTKGA